MGKKASLCDSIIVDVTVPITITGLNTALQDPVKLLQLFIAFKFSNRIKREFTIKYKNAETGYHSNYLTIEGFAHSSAMCEADENRKVGVHTLYKSVWDFTQGICCAYVNLIDFIQNGPLRPFDANFQLNIPMTDVLAFSFFSYLGIFPSFITDIALTDVLTAFGGLVWCLSCPEEVKNARTFLWGTPLTAVYDGLSKIDLDHRFTQINDIGRLPVKFCWYWCRSCWR
jgi:hypothetical protein